MVDSLALLNNGGTGSKLYYNGEEDIPELSTRYSLIEKENNSSIKLVKNHIKHNKKMLFMPIDINENNNRSYTLILFGTLVNGEKAEVNITNVDVFFDVLIPSDISSDMIHEQLLLFLPTTIYFRIEDVYGYSLYGFKEEKQLFKRIYTYNTISRNKLLNLVRNEMNLETFSNDLSHYYRKAAREYKLSLCKWNTLENYKYENNGIHKFTVNIQNYKVLTNEKDLSSPHITKDKTLIITWDIETYSNRKTGEVPMAEHDEDKVFMICLSIHWLHDPEPLEMICIVDKETETDERWTTIVCNSEYNIIKAFAICWNHYNPDIFSGYNDSGYDWPFVIEKARKYDLLPWMWDKMSLIKHRYSTESIIRYSYNNGLSRRIKINAEKQFESKSPIISGTICIDVLPCYMKIYPRSETTKYGSLKFYLQDNNLPSKIDLSPIMLWHYYEEGCLDKMREIAYYCIVDTISVQRLLVKRNVISDYREISSLAYVNLSDSHYYAGGVKVCNLLGSYAWDSNILVNMITTRHTKVLKYPGAYVFPPDKGLTPNVDRIKKLQTWNTEEELNSTIDNLQKDRPVACFDFASLYPSLIITYNLSPEKILVTQEEYQKWNQIYKLHKIEFTLGNEVKTAWSILHNNDDTKMGLFPIILRQLFSKRKAMKTLLKNIETKKIIYEQLLNSTDHNTTLMDMINESSQNSSKLLILQNINTDRLNEEYSNICFEYNYINSKQNALKIYMNTFYGETGNQLSPYFLLELAGGVTSAGQYNIKLVADFIKNKGYNIKYGDTDSIYITPPNLLYREYDLQYAYNKITKEQYYTFQVEITLKLLLDIEKEINLYLEQDNGTTYLRMENEGCNFPCVFLGKKKYFGIQHISRVNFNPKKLYIKGVEVIKQGKSNIEKEIGNTIMRRAVSINNELNILDIVKQTLHEAIHSNKWTIDDYTRISSWKPNKNNQSVQCFMKRMAYRHLLEKQEYDNSSVKEYDNSSVKEYEYSPLEPGEKFSYILVDNNKLFDIQGRNLTIKTGDMMEYLHIAKKYNMKINVAYYLIHYIIGTCARFINSEDRFQPDNSNVNMLSEKKIDEYSIKLAKKELELYVKEIRNITADQINSIKETQKALFKQSIDYSINCYPYLEPIITGPLKKIAFIDYDSNIECTETNIIDILYKSANKRAEKLYKKYFNNYYILLCNECNINHKTGSDIANVNSCVNLYKFVNVNRKKNNYIDYKIRREISNKYRYIIDISIEYKISITEIIDKIKENKDILYIIDQTKFNELNDIWYKIVGIELCNIIDKGFKEYLVQLKNKRIKLSNPISKADIKNIINEAK